jgi:transposase
MIGSTRQVRAFALGRPVDMRKGFEGLAALVRDELGADVLSGDLYLFTGKNRKRAKVLLWDGTGLCLFAKRLERGRFAALWRDAERASLRLTLTELQLFLEGSALVGTMLLSPRALGEKDLCPRARVR